MEGYENQTWSSEIHYENEKWQRIGIGVTDIRSAWVQWHKPAVGIQNTDGSVTGDEAHWEAALRDDDGKIVNGTWQLTV